MVPGDDAWIHRGRRQRGDDPGGGRRRVDPAEERGVPVAHGVRQDVAQHGRNQVVERAPALRQRQVKQLLAQGVGERLPDRAGRQRGEMVGDAVHQSVTGAAERLQLGFADSARGGFAHVARIVPLRANPRVSVATLRRIRVA